MSELTLQQLSEAAKAHYEAREYAEAANCLLEARERFAQADDERLDQGSDGSIVVSSLDVNGQTKAQRGV